MAGNSKLFSFIFLTVKASANDPDSKNFLPTLLSGIKNGGKKLLPLREDNWKIGTLVGQPGLAIAKNIANSYFQFNSQNVIPYPKNPQPSLNLKDASGVNKVSIEGLENVYITGFDNYLYEESTQTVTADIKMQFNYWKNNPGGLNANQKVTPLGLNTPFILTQQLCNSTSQGSNACLDPSAAPINVVGNGTFTAGISQLNFTASIKINVEPNRAGLDLKITKLLLITSGKEAPKFTNIKAVITNNSPLKGIISQLIENFMSQPTASTAVFSQMQDSLNGADNINAISNTLKAQVANFLDLRLGPVTGSLPSDSGQQDTNMVDLYLFDRIRYSLSNPKSSWYVQTLLNSYTNPPLNPFKPSNISIGSFQIMQSFNLTDVTLSNIVITGFPNATAPADTMILAPPSLHMALLLGSLGVGTTANAAFSAKYSNGTASLNFGLEITIKSVSLVSQVTPSGDQATKLDVTFNSVVFDVPNPTDLVIKINDTGPFADAVQKILNSKAIQDRIINEVNSEFKSHLGAISKQVTSLVKKMLDQQLGSGT